MAETANPDQPSRTDSSEETNRVEAANPVQIHMQSGKVHDVEYALRHPNLEWIYAKRITGFEEVEEYENDDVLWNDLVVRDDHVELIESETVSPSLETEPEGLTDSPEEFLIHHSGSLESVDVDEFWKAVQFPLGTD